ncbi:GNAT family N-acetyltransferase [Fructobacillus sp. W13]|uniref:GNAT family N-acetyltransferase n=1 Tax=Fructobacillus apis TaxID=2935017 RepID=A0ABT0ZQR3_9LACO|nr:GNAT family N-acetyltransferase [Fructobacillus apis]MCO0832331.1 GNAT family N-acetyltransferase [Fructobacillus apis]
MTQLNTDFQIAPLAKADLVVYKSSLKAAYRHGLPNRYGEDFPVDLLMPEDEYLNIILKSDIERSFVALQNGAIIAGISFRQDEGSSKAYVNEIFTVPAYQEQGLMTRFFLQLDQQLDDIKTWEYGLVPGDSASMNLFINRLGFEISEFMNERHPEDDKQLPNAGKFIIQKKKP